MDVNFIKMHNPTNAAPEFAGKSHLGDYSDSLTEMDADIGRIMAAIRAQAPNTIVILTADNGAWLDAYPDAGTTPFRGEKGSPFEGGWRVPGIMWWPNHIAAGAQYGEMMSHIDAWATLATMVGLTPPPHDWVGNDGKPIYFDSIDNSAYILGKAPHSARNSWVYIVVGIDAGIVGGEILHLVEAMRGRVGRRLVAEVPLARKVCRVAVLFEEFCDCRCLRAEEVLVARGNHDRQRRADRNTPGNERGAARGAARLAVPVCENGTLLCDLIDVRCRMAERCPAARIGTEIIPAGIVGH
jgi:hypothetical protein